MINFLLTQMFYSKMLQSQLNYVNYNLDHHKIVLFMFFIRRVAMSPPLTGITLTLTFPTVGVGVILSTHTHTPNKYTNTHTNKHTHMQT